MQQNFFELDESYVGGGMGTIDPSSFYTMADETDTLTLPVDGDLSDLHEDGLAASTEAFTLALTLMNYRDKIVAQNGLGMVEVVGIESHVPGLLRYSAPQSFTYEKSKVNMQWSLEAIDGKIGELLKTAGAVFIKLIETVLDKIRKISDWVRKSNLVKKLQYVQTMMRSKVTIIGVREAINYMGEDEFMAYWNKHIRLQEFNHLFKTDVQISDFEGLHTGANIVDVAKILGGKRAIVHTGYNDFSILIKLLDGCHGKTISIAQSMELAKHKFNPTAAKAGADVKHDGKEVADVELPNKTDLSEMVKIFSVSESNLAEVLKHLEVVERNLGKIKQMLKDMDRFVEGGTDQSASEYKKFRAEIYSKMRNIQAVIFYTSNTLADFKMALNTSALIAGCLTKGALSKAKGQTNG